MNLLREYMIGKLVKKFGFEDERVVMFAKRCELYEDSEVADDGLMNDYMELMKENVGEEDE
jgi:hypothetical protein